MAADREGRRAAETITLNQLIETSSIAALRTFKEFEVDRRFNPRIWVGIWIEPYGPGQVDVDFERPG